MRLEHPIFKGPLDPKVETVETETPKNYLDSPGGRDLPAKMPMWKVQTGKFPDTLDVGLVSSPWGFEDSPDAEWISSGVNSKGPRSVALARHGNWFLWGFAGHPGQMTESGRRVFINAVCWMKKFDGRKPIVSKVATARDALPIYFPYLEKMKGQDWMQKLFAEDVRRETALDRAKVEAWYRDNLERIHVVDRAFRADPDLKELGASNRKLEFFDSILARFVKDEKDPVAWRALRRYVPEPKFESAADVRAWVESNRSKLFFTDVGGYRWMAPPKDW